MDGELSASSEFGKGSVFTARIRQKAADTTVLGKDTADKLKHFIWKEEQGEKFYLPYARILVVDDVPTNHAVARGIMRPYRMTIDTVLSGPEAIDLMDKAEVHYDAIFMDHMMPGMDGVEAVNRIRGLDTDYARTIPIIALTANALPENEELFLANGFNVYMTKPINTNVLNNVLYDWVRDAEKEKLFAGEVPEEEEQEQSGILSDYDIEGVDLTAGAAQFGGEKNYLEIVKVFVNNTPKLLEDIQKFLDGFRIMPKAAATALESLKNYTITAHGLKGSCYGICAKPLGDLAREMEMAAKSQDLGKVIELNNRFTQEMTKLVEQLKELFPKKDKKTKPEKDCPDMDVLRKLLRTAQSYNIDNMFSVMNELEQYSYKEKDDFIEQLRQAVDNYEYTEVIKLLWTYVSEAEENDISLGNTG
jgi:CheY-like chemotaxis protein